MEKKQRFTYNIFRCLLPFKYSYLYICSSQRFDTNDNISLKIKPSIENLNNTKVIGLSLNINLIRQYLNIKFGKMKKGPIREWFDALLFAVIAASLIRWATLK